MDFVVVDGEHIICQQGDTARTFYLIALALLIIAALGGLSVRYMDGKLELLQPNSDHVQTMEDSPKGGK